MWVIVPQFKSSIQKIQSGFQSNLSSTKHSPIQKHSDWKNLTLGFTADPGPAPKAGKQPITIVSKFIVQHYNEYTVNNIYKWYKITTALYLLSVVRLLVSQSVKASSGFLFLWIYQGKIRFLSRTMLSAVEASKMRLALPSVGYHTQTLHTSRCQGKRWRFSPLAGRRVTRCAG